jgi:hypothetical protein
MRALEPSTVLPFPANWYRGHARLSARNVLISAVNSRLAQAVAVAYAREGAVVFIPGLQGSAATRLCYLIVKEGGRAILLQGVTEHDQIQGLRCILPNARLDVLLNIAPPSEIAFGEAYAPEQRSATAAKIIAPTIEMLAAHKCAPHLVINAIFDINDDRGCQTEAFAVEEAAHVDLSQELLVRSIRVNAVRIPHTQSVSALYKQLEELAMAFVYLSTAEAADINGMVLAKETEVLGLH